MFDPRFKRSMLSSFLNVINNDETEDSDTPVTQSACKAVTPTNVTNDDEAPVKRMKYSVYTVQCLGDDRRGGNRTEEGMSNSC